MPQSWTTLPTTRESVTVEQPIEIDHWWTVFRDPTLDSLIRRAVASNLTVEAATERVYQARATVGFTRGGLFPSASFNGSYARQGSGTSHDSDLWQSGFDAAWEVDVFGGIRRGVEAAKANLQASIEDRRDILVTLLGEVATDYIFLRDFQQEVEIARQNLNIQIRSAAVTRAKKRLGTDTDLDIAQADALVAGTEADIQTLEVNEQQTIYALSVLLGEPPTALDGELSVVGPIPEPPSVIAIGLPAELLNRRPDIRRAERQLAAATAQIGAATANWYPTFSLTGNLSIQSSNFAGLGSWPNHLWSVGPNMTWLIFDGGQVSSNVAIQNALQAQAFTTYKQTVLTALQDVENSLVAYAREQRRRDALSREVNANERAVALSTRRYNQGLTDFLSVLVAESSLFSSQVALVQSNRNIGADAVALYKALGGGWSIAEMDSATASTLHPKPETTATGLEQN